MNVIIISGNLGGDVEERTFDDGSKKFWTLNVATSEVWKDKATGEKKTHTTWHRCQMFGNYENLAQYLVKGQSVEIRGLQRNDVIPMKMSGEPVIFDGKPIMQKIPFIKVQDIALTGSKPVHPIPSASFVPNKIKDHMTEKPEEGHDDLPF